MAVQLGLPTAQSSVRGYVFWALSLLAASVVFKIFKVPTNQMCDVLVLGLVAQRIVFVRGSLLRLADPLIFALAAYVMYGLVVSHEHGVKLSDYIWAFKGVIYVVLMVIATSSVDIDRDKFENITKTVIITFLIDYILQRAIGNPRPEFFIENNYELATVVILYFGAFSYRKKLPLLWAGLLVAVCFISGSRSALGASIIAIGWTFRPRGVKDVLLMIFAAIVGLGLFYVVFVGRLSDASDASSIDRLAFLAAFEYEVHDWGVWQYMFGTPPVTPLSVETCYQLQFYQALLSDQHLYTCYSLILHSYILRTVFDHGVVGLLAILTVVYRLFRSVGDTPRVSLGFVVICVANALSVSALSSGFVVLGLCIVLISVRSNRPTMSLRLGGGKRVGNRERKAGEFLADPI